VCSGVAHTSMNVYIIMTTGNSREREVLCCQVGFCFFTAYNSCCSIADFKMLQMGYCIYSKCMSNVMRSSCSQTNIFKVLCFVGCVCHCVGVCGCAHVCMCDHFTCYKCMRIYCLYSCNIMCNTSRLWFFPPSSSASSFFLQIRIIVVVCLFFTH